MNHSPAEDGRNAKIEEILNKAVVLELEQSGLKAVVLQDSAEAYSPALIITGHYLLQKDTLKLEYHLQVAATGKEIAETRINASVSHFLDRAVANAVKELLQEGKDEINRIALAKRKQDKQEQDKADEQEGEPAVVAEETDREAESEEKSEPEPEIGVERRPHRVEAEAKVSGAYMLGQTSEYLPHALLLEGRISYPLMQREKMAWRLGGSIGIMRFSSADNYKAAYVKTLLPVGLLNELRLRKASLNKKSGWVFRFWWTAGAALRLPHEDEAINEVLAPALPYANTGIGVRVPLISDRLGLLVGFSGMGLFHLYEKSDTGEVTVETLLGINIDLGIVLRM